MMQALDSRLEHSRKTRLFSGLRHQLCGLALVCGVMLAAVPARAQDGQPTAKELITQLQSGTAQQKATAADDLADIRGSNDVVVPALVAALSDSDVSVRWRAARSLGELKVLNDTTEGALRKALADPEAAVRVNAALALGRINANSDTTVKQLIRLASTDSDERVVRACLQALRGMQLDPKLVVADLVEILDEDDQRVASHAMEVLVERGPASVPFLIEALNNDGAAYWASVALEQIGPDAAPAAPALAELLKRNSDPQVQLQATLAVAALGNAGQSAVPVLVPLLKSDDAPLARAAAFALGRVGGADAMNALQQELGSGDDSLVMIAAWGLAFQHPEDRQALELAVKHLVEGLKSTDPLVRSAAAWGLAELKAPPELTAPALIQIASDGDPAVLANVVNALTALGPAAVPRAVAALDNPKLRDVAIAVLYQLGPAGKDAIPALIEHIKADDPLFTAKVQQTLAQYGPDAAAATDKLIPSLNSTDERLRHTAMFTLGRIGPAAQAAVGPLEKVLTSGDDFDKIAAAWALVMIQPDNASVVRAALPQLVRGLSNDQVVVRLNVAETLGGLGEAASSAIVPLESLAQHDPDPQVRTTAAAAVAKIKGR